VTGRPGAPRLLLPGVTATIEYGTSPGPRLNGGPARSVPVVVIGAGQAGLSAAYHLRRRSIDFVVLDAEDGPGGAWRHRWRSLRMATVNGIFDLPGMPKPPVDPDEPAADAVPRYFAAYEREFGFPILRPVRVQAVRRAWDVLPVLAGAGLAGAGLAEAGLAGVGVTDPGDLIVYTDHGTWAARGIISAAGTWTTPNWPWYPGAETFAGRQLHVAQYVSAAEFAGQHVVVVGGGISAIQLLDDMGGIALDGTAVAADPRIHLIGYVPSQSTVGANRAGRAAATALAKLLDRT
jgi:cation diffusion facilitator CzcD-associated flavoprotein CzcO